MSHPRPRADRGAAAVEAALVGSFILVPLLLGVLSFGYYLWKLQRVPLLDPQLDQTAFVGEICEGELVSRVRTATLTTLENAEDAASLPVSLSDITASVVPSEVGGLGVTVNIGVTVPLLTSSFIPLPNDGNVTNDVQVRLQNVVLKTGC